MNGAVAVEDREAALMTCPSVRRLGVGAGERYGGGGGSRDGSDDVSLRQAAGGRCR